MGLLILLVAIAVVCWQRFVPPPTTTESWDPTYESYVRHHGKTDVPTTAHNIRFVWADCGLSGHAAVCRFEAPLDDLRAYAIAEAKRRTPGAEIAPRLVKMIEPARQPDLTGYGIRPLEWFDVERIEEGLVLKRTDKREPFMWVDARRSVLYAYWTN
jgi:hypothetical protein